MKVVFDTNVLLSSTLWDNSSAQKLLIKLIENDIINSISIEILQEYKEILERDFSLAYEEIILLSNKILSFSELVYPEEKINFVVEDSDDNTIIECAKEAQANYIITYDKHLLKLKAYNEIKITTPEEFMSFIS